MHKYILLVDATGGPLCAMARKLRELEFRTVLVSDERAALNFVRNFNKLGLVAVGPSMDAQSLLSELRGRKLSTPVLWVDEYGVNIDSRAGQCRRLGAITPVLLEECAAEALCQHYYPDQLAATFAQVAACALGAFQAYSAVGEPFLRAGRGRLGELSALITFSGREASGHLIVSTSQRTASDMRARLFDDVEQADADSAADILGELCNRTLGPLQVYLEGRGIEVCFGVPMYLRGEPTVWGDQPQPSLGIEFEGASGRISMEFSIDAFVPSVVSSISPAELRAQGSHELIIL